LQYSGASLYKPTKDYEYLDFSHKKLPMEKTAETISTANFIIETLDQNLQTWEQHYRKETNSHRYPPDSLQKWVVEQALHSSVLREYGFGTNSGPKTQKEIAQVVIQHIHKGYPLGLRLWTRDNLQLSELGLVDDATRLLVEQALKFFPDLKK